MTTASSIRTAAVLGAGTMGAQIAAHLANAGVPVLLLDVTSDVARDGLKQASALKPDPFFTKSAAALITTGGFDTDLETLRDGRLDHRSHRRAARHQAVAVRARRSRASRRTRSCRRTRRAFRSRRWPRAGATDFRRHWLGTHFFNPPRYLRLARAHSDAGHRSGRRRTASAASPITGSARASCSRRTRRTSSPITSGCSASCSCCARSNRATTRSRRSTRSPARRSAARRAPRSGRWTSRASTCSVTSLRNLAERLPERDRRGALRAAGDRRAADRARMDRREGRARDSTNAKGREILTLDPATMTYRAEAAGAACRRSTPRKGIESSASGRSALFLGQDKVGAFLRDTLGPTLVYAAERRAGHRALDRRRRSRDAVGIRLGARPVRAVGRDRHPGRCSTRSTACGRAAARRPSRSRRRRDRFRDGLRAARRRRACRCCASAKERTPVVQRNPGASLVDLGDGVLCVEFHSKMNAIGGDTIQMLQAGLKRRAANFAALVVGNDAAELLRRRQPDARAARSAGGQLGRDRPDGPHVPAGDAGAALRRRCRWSSRRAGWRSAADARSCCTAIACRRRPRPTSAWSKSASA